MAGVDRASFNSLDFSSDSITAFGCSLNEREDFIPDGCLHLAKLDRITEAVTQGHHLHIRAAFTFEIKAVFADDNSVFSHEGGSVAVPLSACGHSVPGNENARGFFKCLLVLDVETGTARLVGTGISARDCPEAASPGDPSLNPVWSWDDSMVLFIGQVIYLQDGRCHDLGRRRSEITCHGRAFERTGSLLGFDLGPRGNLTSALVIDPVSKQELLRVPSHMFGEFIGTQRHALLGYQGDLSVHIWDIDRQAHLRSMSFVFTFPRLTLDDHIICGVPKAAFDHSGVAKAPGERGDLCFADFHTGAALPMKIGPITSVSPCASPDQCSYACVKQCKPARNRSADQPMTLNMHVDDIPAEEVDQHEVFLVQLC